MNWTEFVSLLRRRARRILSTIAAGIGLALAYLLIATPEYSATARLIIDTRSKKILSVEEVLPSLPSEIAMIESQVEILRSRRIAKLVLVEAASHSNHVSDASDGDAAEKLAIDEAALFDLMDSLNIERKGLSYVIDVTFKDRDPKKAAQIANAMADAYVADQLATKTNATRDANKWLKARVGEMSGQLRNAEERVARYRAQHGLVRAGEILLSEREIVDYTHQLILVRTKVAETKARLELVEKLAETPDELVAMGKVLESEVIVDLRRQQAEIQRSLGKMVSRLGEQHPSAVDARAELETLERDIAQEVGRVVKNVTNEFELGKMQSTILQIEIAVLKKQYAERNLITIGLSELERNAEATRHLYTSLLRRLKETDAQQSLQTADARIIAYAYPPLYPSSPRKALILALALVGSLMVGILIAMLEDMYASSKRGHDDVERHNEGAVWSRLFLDGLRKGITKLRKGPLARSRLAW